ncbi:MAG TPA: hypothetical protein VFM49_29760 [Chloroflexia bacterium]|nr:hypothetical protein [Chloroflexia bacterium]
MSNGTLAATWRERLKGALRLIAILIGLNVIPLSVKTSYTGQGSILDIVGPWLIIGPIAALGGFLVPVGEGPFTPPTALKRRRMALTMAALAGVLAAMLVLDIVADITTDKPAAAVTTAILCAVWMGLAMFVLTPAEPTRPPISRARRRHNV